MTSGDLSAPAKRDTFRHEESFLPSEIHTQGTPPPDISNWVRSVKFDFPPPRPNWLRSVKSPRNIALTPAPYPGHSDSGSFCKTAEPPLPTANPVRFFKTPRPESCALPNPCQTSPKTTSGTPSRDNLDISGCIYIYVRSRERSFRPANLAIPGSGCRSELLHPRSWQTPGNRPSRAAAKEWFWVGIRTAFANQNVLLPARESRTCQHRFL